MMIYPLTIGAACLLTSIIGTFFVKLGKNKNVMNALYKGFIVSAVASLAKDATAETMKPLYKAFITFLFFPSFTKNVPIIDVNKHAAPIVKG